MANWNGLQLTNKGIALQAKVQAGTQLHITKLKLGSGVVPGGTDIKTLNDLIAPEQNLGIGGKEAVDDYCKISSTISNTGLEAGYYVRELGVFAQDPDGGEVLYAYTTDGAPDYLPAGGGSTVISQEFSVMIAVDDVDNIEVDIDPAALATMGYVQLQITEHNIDEDAHEAAFNKHNADVTAHLDMVGATAEAAGKRGMVPAPAQGKPNTVLAGDGAWRDFATEEQAKAGTDDTHPMTPAKTKAAIEALVEGIPVGDVVYRPFLMSGYVKANGATVNRADYPNLVQYANDHSLWTSNPSSEPWKYGQGNGSTTMTLPDYRNRVLQGGDTASIKSAGLPNVTGRFTNRAAIDEGNQPVTLITSNVNAPAGGSNGCFSSSGVTKWADGAVHSNLLTNNNTSGYLQQLVLDLSSENSIYGKSNTVQPPAVQLIPQIRF